MHLSKPLLGLGLLAAVPLSAAAATYNVGPGRQYTQLTTFFNSVNLAPGDIVLLKSSHGSGLRHLGDRLVEPTARAQGGTS